MLFVTNYLFIYDAKIGISTYIGAAGENKFLMRARIKK